MKCEWFPHGKTIPDEYDVVMADIDKHHTNFAVLVEIEREGARNSNGGRKAGKSGQRKTARRKVD